MSGIVEVELLQGSPSIIEVSLDASWVEIGPSAQSIVEVVDDASGSVQVELLDTAPTVEQVSSGVVDVELLSATATIVEVEIGGSSAVDLPTHDALDTLTHAIAESSQTEFAYTGDQLTRVTVWTDGTHTTKIRESLLTYTGDDLTGIVTTQHNAAGAVIATLTKTLTYSGGSLVTSTAVRS